MERDLINTERVPGLARLLFGVDLSGGLKSGALWGWLGSYRFALAVGGRGVYLRLFLPIEGRCLVCDVDKQGQPRLLCRKKGFISVLRTATLPELLEGGSRTELCWYCAEHAPDGSAT